MSRIWLLSLNSSITVAIIAAATTVFASVLTLVVGKAYEFRMLIRKEHHEKKTPVYEDLIKFIMEAMTMSKLGKPKTDEELIEFLTNFNQRFMVWGSDEVVAAFVKWRRASSDDSLTKDAQMRQMFLYEDLLFAIRRDLGHKNKGLIKGDMLALFVTDIDQHLTNLNT